MGRERRSSQEHLRQWEDCKAKGSREVQTRKAVLTSPACHLLFRHQHLVASPFPAVTPTHQMNTQRDILDGEASPQELLPSCSEEIFRQLFPTTPQENGAEGNRAALIEHSPIKEISPHSRTSRRGYASLCSTFRAQGNTLICLGRSPASVRDETLDYTEMGLGSVLIQ